MSENIVEYHAYNEQDNILKYIEDVLVRSDVNSVNENKLLVLTNIISIFW